MARSSARFNLFLGVCGDEARFERLTHVLARAELAVRSIMPDHGKLIHMRIEVCLGADCQSPSDRLRTDTTEAYRSAVPLSAQCIGSIAELWRAI